MYRTKVFAAILSLSGDSPIYFHHARLDGPAPLVNARNWPVRGGNTNEFDGWEEAPGSRVGDHGYIRIVPIAAVGLFRRRRRAAVLTKPKGGKTVRQWRRSYRSW